MVIAGRHCGEHMVNNGPRAHGPKGPKSGADSLNNNNPNNNPPPDARRTFSYTKKVGNYLVGRKLGEGSFAKVREGLHTVTGEKVAVKVMDKRKAKKDSYMTKNLRREGHIQQMVRHPNIVQLLDVLETESSYYLVMELCTGGSIMDQLLEKKRMGETEVRKYVRQLVEAVEHLHRAGVVHRDLKAENILLDENDNVKLTDFGLSNCAEMLGYTDPFSTQCGSPAYAAPELLSHKKYGPKVDVWSIGVNMYAMLTGNLPFTVEPFNFRSLLQKMVDKNMNPLPPHLSPAAVSLLKSLLEPDPARRPSIHQVMSDPWFHLGSPQLDSHLNKVHPDEVNHAVVLRMTEQMGYQYGEVMNAVLTNRACHTLTVYFLLDRRGKRLTKVQQEQQIPENQWTKHAYVNAASPTRTPACFHVKKNPPTENNQGAGLQMDASSSLGYFGISSALPYSSQSIRHQDAVTLANGGSEQVESQLPIPSRTLVHSRNSAFKEPHKSQPAPWYKLVNGSLPAPRQPSAFQPYSPYMKKVLASSPSAELEPQGTTGQSNWGCLESSNRSSAQQYSPKRQGKVPSMSQGNILKSRSPPFRLMAAPPAGLQLPMAPPPHHLRKLFCTSRALRIPC
ncbi:hormonally up-regulated neu tumor-associated kinase homolog [Scleropages formosus]|uniref:non-specific serine/threonine protein kinase n=1 Tax=Scleropages formosus TaxID=113540 RepID=A0A8C9UWL7_SCLFO|nr:hormonally up-regulated neu tumor-associated kinase homolog [Scleropages formosus]